VPQEGGGKKSRKDIRWRGRAERWSESCAKKKVLTTMLIEYNRGQERVGNWGGKRGREGRWGDRKCNRRRKAGL